MEKKVLDKLQDEKKNLHQKINRLKHKLFWDSDDLSQDQKDLMQSQLAAMQVYEDILKDRINDIKKDDIISIDVGVLQMRRGVWNKLDKVRKEHGMKTITEVIGMELDGLTKRN